MFGERIDNHITMLQRLVALLRDLILGVTVFLASIIVYFGGDASKLTSFDWAKLVGSAFFIVIGPILTYIAIKILFDSMLDWFNYIISLYESEGKAPRGSFAYVMRKIRRFSKREYLKYWSKRRELIKTIALQDPARISSRRSKLAGVHRFYKVLGGIYPYISAVMILWVSIYLLRRAILAYIPQ